MGGESTTQAIEQMIRWEAGAADGPVIGDLRLDRRDDLSRALAAPTDADERALLTLAWGRWGENLVDRLDGDYAIAVFDARRREIVLTRDPVGMRPLFFAIGPDGVAVASSPRAVNRLLSRRDRPDPARLRAHLLASAPTDGSTFFADVAQVEPGEVVRIERDGSVRRRRHWPTRRGERWDGRSDPAVRLRQLLDQAVGERIGGAQSVATHLSAGLDSSAVTAAAAVRGDVAVDAFTAIPDSDAPAWRPDRLANEGAIAALLADRYPTIRHHLVRPGQHAFDLFDMAYEAFEQPMANPVNFDWVAAINSAARELGHSVMLIGQFGNYAFSASAGPPHWLRAMLARAVGRTATPPSPFLAPEHRPTHPDRTPGDRWQPFRAINPGPHVLGTWRAWGLELRDATADRDLVDFCLSVPGREIRKNGETRLLARRVAAGLLPAAMLSEPRRGYQSADWLTRLAARSGQAHDIIDRFATEPLAADLLDIAALRRAALTLPGLGNSPSVEMTFRAHFLRALSVGDFIAQAARDAR